MAKELSMEDMAEMSIEQIDAMANGEEPAEGKEDLAEGSPTETTEQVVEEGAATGAEGEAVGGVAMKSGKGTIPYAVLKETREELAEARRRIEALESKKSYHAEISENHESLVAQANEKINALVNKFEDADISTEEFQAELAKITGEKEALLAAKIKSEIADEMRIQQEQKAVEDSDAAWRKTVDVFLLSKPDGVDYNADQEKFAELDAAIKMFASNPANANRDHQWFLTKAHGEVLENNGIKPQPTPPTPPVVEAKDKPTELDKPPIFSLSDIPGGLSPDGGTEADQVVALSGAALTNRFLNDPAQIDKVLAGLR